MKSENMRGSQMLKVIDNAEIFWTQKPIDASQIKKINNYNIVLPNQTHSDVIELVSSYTSSSIYADALISPSPDFFIAIKTADCLPLLVIGDTMVGAIHAGWKGLSKNIIYKTLEKMDDYGCNIKKIFVGAHICKNCYEVGEEVLKAFPEYYRNEKFFRKLSWGNYLMDLFEIAKYQIELFNPNIKVEHINLYTCCNNNLFYSYRKDKTYKRNLWAIRLIRKEF